MQAVSYDRHAAGNLEAEILRSFGRHVWIDAAGGQEIAFRTWDKDRPPTLAERLDGRTMSTCRTIESEGDGLKSYLAICAALVLGPSPVCLIDEPELCLHPPQAFNLGRFIGKHAGNTKNANFVATHSSQVLRGILNSGTEMQVLRVSRLADRFRAKAVSAEDVRKYLGKPTVRAETILDGLFAQAVVIVEAEGDRIVCQAAWQSSPHAAAFDIHFTPIGGSGAADACSLYKLLEIPTAVIADFDLITAPARFAKIVRASASGPAGDQLINAAAELLRRVNALGAAKTVTDAKADLNSVLGSVAEMSEETLVARLNDVVRSIKPSARFKRPIAELPEPERAMAEELVRNGVTIGVYLVPVGVLENWLEAAGIKASKSHKQEWALEAARHIEAAVARADDVWEFTQSIASYLRRTLDLPQPPAAASE